MTFIATGRYTVLRTTTETSYTGDTTDVTAEPILTGVRGSVLEVNRTIIDEAKSSTGIVRELRARFPPRTPIIRGDQIEDERTRVRFVVEDVYAASDAITASDIRLTLSATQ